MDRQINNTVVKKLTSLDKDFDASKINWLDRPKDDVIKAAQYDIDFIKEVKTVDEIE